MIEYQVMAVLIRDIANKQYLWYYPHVDTHVEAQGFDLLNPTESAMGAFRALENLKPRRITIRQGLILAKEFVLIKGLELNSIVTYVTFPWSII